MERVTFADGKVLVEGGGGEAASARARDELDLFLKKWDPLLNLFADDVLLHPLSLPHFLARGWRHFGLLRGTVASSLTRDFSHDAVRAAMSGALLYSGMPPEKVSAASLLGLAAMFRHGFYIPEGGMGSLPEALGNAVREAGGEIRLRANVTQILVRRGRAYGVALDDGDIVEADAIISTTSGMHTTASLLSRTDVPARMARKVRQAPLSHKGFALQLGLSNRIDVRSYSNNILPLLSDQSQLFIADNRRLQWPVYMVPTLAIPELAPDGGSVVEVFPPICQEWDAADWTEQRKDAVATQAITRLKELHRMDIVTCRMLSPKEFQRDTHLYAGALYGLMPLASPTTQFKHRSPMPRLYQAGQTTWPGFGVASAGISGVIAAEALMRDVQR